METGKGCMLLFAVQKVNHTPLGHVYRFKIPFPPDSGIHLPSSSCTALKKKIAAKASQLSLSDCIFHSTKTKAWELTCKIS